MLPPDKISLSQIMRIQAPARPGDPADQQIDYRSTTRAPADSTDHHLELRRFRDDVYKQLEAIPSHYTVECCAVDISEDGFSAMYNNADYHKQIIGQIRREFGTSYAPRRVRVHIQVGRTFDEYHVLSWASAFAADYEIYAKHSFYRRTGSAPVAAPQYGSQPSAYDIYRDHLQMQFEKLENPPPQHAPQPRRKTQSIYEEMGYEDSEPENHDFQG